MSKSLAPALSGGLHILELISKEGHISFSQLESISGLTTSTLNRLLKTLVEANALNKNKDGQYILGPSLFLMTWRNSFWTSLIENARPILEKIRENHGVTAVLLIHSNQGFTIIDKKVHPDNIALRRVGETKPDYLLSPWGLLYMSTLNSENFKATYRAYENSTPKSLKTPSLSDLKEDMSFIAKHAYSDDHGTILNGIRRISAPIFNNSQGLEAYLAIGSMSAVLDETKAQEIGNLLIQKAASLRNRLS